ncbi:MAG: hypothetical protein M1826_004952 [Phylliscum demangeonii]|nr:MAG: hypothetical protein M1826_004952 [Phylliscum demangeonii]
MLLFGLGGLGSLIYVSILLVNAIAILSEDRFLARIGWSAQSFEPTFGSGGVGGSGADGTSVKAKMVNLITSVRTLMRIPLIAINTLVIAYEIVLG